jgi:hypothetical protein
MAWVFGLHTPASNGTAVGPGGSDLICLNLHFLPCRPDYNGCHLQVRRVDELDLSHVAVQHPAPDELAAQKVIIIPTPQLPRTLPELAAPKVWGFLLPK